MYNEGAISDGFKSGAKKGAIGGAAAGLGAAGIGHYGSKKMNLPAANASKGVKAAATGVMGALGAGVGALAGGAAGAAKAALKKRRAAKAQEVAVEEGCTLDEAFEYVLECEQAFLDEGYDFDEIYDEGEKWDAVKGAPGKAFKAVKKGAKAAGGHVMAHKKAYGLGAAGSRAA